MTSRAEWAGIGMGDALAPDLEPWQRAAAQRRLFDAVRRAQRVAAVYAGASRDGRSALRTEPQLGPLRTTYPSAIAARACVGLSAYLELSAWLRPDALAFELGSWLADPWTVDRMAVDPGAYRELAKMATTCVHRRLLLEDLSRHPDLGAVDTYRIFLASCQRLRFDTLAEILDAAVLYGDLLPAPEWLDLHPTAHVILTDAGRVCAPFFTEIRSVALEELMHVGARWVREVCRELARHLPDPDRGGSVAAAPAPRQRLAPLRDVRRPLLNDAPPGTRLAHAASEESDDDDGLVAPGPMPAEPELREALEQLGACAERASGGEQPTDAPRADRTEHRVAASAFSSGPCAGMPTDGHRIDVHLATSTGDEETSADLLERALAPTDDESLCARLANEVTPVARALRRVLYPDVEEATEVVRPSASGALDPARLPTAFVSGAVHLRRRAIELQDPRGRAVVLVACDASASLTASQMRMTKVLAGAWVESATGTGVRVLACVYHGVPGPDRAERPIVQWMAHPRKTPARSAREVQRAIAALPDTGTGAQSDVISLTFALAEAERLARGRTVYLVLVSDTAWNRSLRRSRSGGEEMRGFLDALRRRARPPHVTLVAVGTSGLADVRPAIDELIAVGPEELADHIRLAERVSNQVARAIRAGRVR